MEQGPQVVLKMLLHWLVVRVVCNLAIQFCIAICTNSGRKGSEGNMYITSSNNKIKNPSWTPRRNFDSGTGFCCVFNDS